MAPTPPRERIENRWSPLECRTQAPLEMIVVHRLAKVANNPVLKCPIPDDVIGVCGNENCRDRVPRHDQLPVQLDPVIPGMWTSVTKQAVWAREGDTRKSAADGKASQQSSAGAL